MKKKEGAKSIDYLCGCTQRCKTSGEPAVHTLRGVGKHQDVVDSGDSLEMADGECSLKEVK